MRKSAIRRCRTTEALEFMAVPWEERGKRRCSQSEGGRVHARDRRWGTRAGFLLACLLASLLPSLLPSFPQHKKRRQSAELLCFQLCRCDSHLRGSPAVLRRASGTNCRPVQEGGSGWAGEGAKASESRSLPAAWPRGRALPSSPISAQSASLGRPSEARGPLAGRARGGRGGSEDLPGPEASGSPSPSPPAPSAGFGPRCRAGPGAVPARPRQAGLVPGGAAPWTRCGG